MKQNKLLKNALISILCLASATLICRLLSGLADDNNPWAVSVFILAAALTARLTDRPIWGIAVSAAGVICVNLLFTYPFGEFNMTIPGYPLIFACMGIVSIMISTLTSRIKQQDRIRLEMEKEKLRADLLRSVSHDIRTPLTAITGASSALLENADLPEESKHELLEEINKDAKWLTRLTENILSVSKLSGGDVKIRKEEEYMDEIISAAIVKYRRMNGALPIRVTKPDEMVFVPMDATLIEQVLLNLFENAADHGISATVINVLLQYENGFARVTVKDDGQGIDAEILPRLFDIYVKADSGPARGDRSNMGIGLSVCRSIIAAHGGTICASNPPEGGAEISFTLPLA